MATIESDGTYWTIAYRNPRANRFKRATDLHTSWGKARDIGRATHIAHPELEVWIVTTREAECAGWIHPEDRGNILANSGRRVLVVDNGSLASLS